MWDDLVALRGEVLDEIERGVETLRGRSGHGQLHVARHVLEDSLLDAVERDDLVARAGEELGEDVLEVPHVQRSSVAASSESFGRSSSRSSS